MAAQIKVIDRFRTTNAHKKLVDSLKHRVSDHLLRLVTIMFNEADDFFFELAEKETSSERQSRLFDSMHMLRARRQAILERFMDALEAHLYPIHNNDGAGESLELSLLDQEAQEENLIVASLGRAASERCGESIAHLEARLEMLSMKTNLIFEQTALMPESVAGVFHLAINDIDLDTQEKQLLLRLFGKVFIEGVVGLYKELNELLVAQNILPQIPVATRRGRRAGDVKAPDSSKSESANVSAESPVAVQSRVDAFILSVINGEVTVAGTDIPVSLGATVASPEEEEGVARRDDLVNAISLIQSYQEEMVPGERFSIARFKRDISYLINSTTADGDRKLSSLDEKVIDFVEMLFNYLIDNSHASIVINGLLLRLQIPVIKTALIDEQLFFDQQHPVRLFMDLLLWAGRGVNAEDDLVYIKLKQITNQLLREFDTNVEAFKTAAEQTRMLIKSEDAQHMENEELLMKKAFKDQAKQVVLSLLRSHFKPAHVPQVLHPFILKNLSTLSYKAYMDNSTEQEWAITTNILKLTLRSLNSIESQNDWHGVNQQFRPILALLKEKLKASKQRPEEVEASLEMLEKIYVERLQQSEYKIEALLKVKYAGPVADEKLANALLDDDFEHNPVYSRMPGQAGKVTEDKASWANQEAVQNLPECVKPGAWFKVYERDGAPTQVLKLSVLLLEQARLIFVDRHGSKRAEKTAQQFALELNEHKSRPIGDASAFNNALDGLAQRLSNKAQAKAQASAETGQEGSAYSA